MAMDRRNQIERSSLAPRRRGGVRFVGARVRVASDECASYRGETSASATSVVSLRARRVVAAALVEVRGAPRGGVGTGMNRATAADRPGQSWLFLTGIVAKS
jgi:hypothetical protein